MKLIVLTALLLMGCSSPDRPFGYTFEDGYKAKQPPRQWQR